jgi:hypothetical protein
MLVMGKIPTDGRRMHIDAVWCSTAENWLMRRGRIVRAAAMARRFFIMLAANAPSVVTRDHAVEVMYGHRANGGPLNMDGSLGQLFVKARFIGAVLGFSVECVRPFGWRATAVSMNAPQERRASGRALCGAGALT